MFEFVICMLCMFVLWSMSSWTLVVFVWKWLAVKFSEGHGERFHPVTMVRPTSVWRETWVYKPLLDLVWGGCLQWVLCKKFDHAWGETCSWFGGCATGHCLVTVFAAHSIFLFVLAPVYVTLFFLFVSLFFFYFIWTALCELLLLKINHHWHFEKSIPLYWVFLTSPGPLDNTTTWHMVAVVLPGQ